MRSLSAGFGGDLDVGADRNVRVRRHGPAVRVGQRDLVLTGALKLRQHFLASCAALSDRGYLLRQVPDPRAAGWLVDGITGIQAPEVVVELGVRPAMTLKNCQFPTTALITGQPWGQAPP